MKNKTMGKVLLTTSIAAVCGQSIAATDQQGDVRNPRIIGGTTAQVDAYPWMVSLQGGGQHFCGGSLINREWVLTAAHCIEGESAGGVQVVVGDYDVSRSSDGGQQRQISRIVIHPQRVSSSDDHDIALLKLQSPVTGSPVLAATPTVMQGISNGSLLTVMGWGSRNANGEDFPNQLHEVQVPLVSNAQCSQNYGAGSITANMVCAGFTQGGKDSCQGDSGGPLLYQLDGQWHQVGIVSFGEGCALPNYPGVYARVERYVDWIAGLTSGQINPDDNSGGGQTDTTGGNGGADNTDNNIDDTDFTDNTDDNTDQNIVLTGADMLNLPEYIDLFSFDGADEETMLFLENMTDSPMTFKKIRTNKPQRFAVDGSTCTTLEPGGVCSVALTYKPHPNREFTQGRLVIKLQGVERIRVPLYGENLALYQDNFNWDDDGEWFADNDNWLSEDDSFYLYGAYVGEGERAAMSTRVKGPGTLSFSMQLPDGVPENSVTYLVDGKPVKSVTGKRKTALKHTTQLSDGEHEISWVYNKRKQTAGQVKISDLRYEKSAMSVASGGGGSANIWFLSGLLLMLAGIKGFARRKV